MKIGGGFLLQLFYEDFSKVNQKGKAMEKMSWTEDCIECEKEQTLSVTGFVDVDTGEVLKFCEQECYACGWNQLS